MPYMDIFNEVATNAITLDSMSGNVGYTQCSYFTQTVDYLIEYNHEINTAIKTLYTNINESGNDIDIINESFATFGATIKKIIDKFLAFIKSLFQRFITNLNSMVKSEKYLKKHEKDLKKFGEQHEFEFQGYEFTVFDNDIPRANALSEFTSGVDIDFAEIGKNYVDGNNNKWNDADTPEKKKNITDEVEKALKQKYQALVDYLAGDYYDRLRATIIGKDGTRIADSDFSKELFSVFRNGESDSHSITVNSSYVIATYNRFDGYEKAKRAIEKKKTEIEKEYTDIKKELETMGRSTGTGDELKLMAGPETTAHASSEYHSFDFIGGQSTKTIETNIELYKKAKINQVQEMSNIHALAFAAKLDAAKDSFNQDKAVLYKALYKIQGMSKNNN